MKRVILLVALGCALAIPVAAGVFSAAPCGCCSIECQCDNCRCDELGCACESGVDCPCDATCCEAGGCPICG